MCKELWDKEKQIEELKKEMKECGDCHSCSFPFAGCCHMPRILEHLKDDLERIKSKNLFNMVKMR